MKMPFPHVIAKLSLFLATLIWGSTFILMKNMLNTVGTYHLLAIRFSAAAVLLGYAYHDRLRTVNMHLLLRGFLLGLFLFLAYAAQTVGLKTISPGKSAFLSTTYCIFTPTLSWLFLRERPRLRQLTAAFICLLGIACISLDGKIALAPGEVITLCGGIFFSLHVMDLSHHSRDLSIIPLTVLQFMTSSALAWGCAFFLETPDILLTPAVSASLFYLSILGTALAFLLQNSAQKYLSASAASLILSFEAVFGAVFSALFANESLTPRTIMGFSLILGAILLSEVRVSSAKHTK